MATIVAMLISAAAYTAAPQPAQVVTPICGSEQRMLGLVFRKFGEFPIFRGEINEYTRYILTRNDRNGSWTLLSEVDGVACVIAVGKRSALDKGV